MIMAGMKRALGVALAVGLVAGAAVAQELSETAVKKYMDYAWNLTPNQFTSPKGEVTVIDKKQREANTVPVATAREVIMAARLSAHAQLCDLKAEEVANYHSLMYREKDRKDGDKPKWSPQQIIYINQLHLATVMLLTGKLKVVQKEGEKEVAVEESKTNTPSCPPEQRAKVKEAVKAYVDAGPPDAKAELAAANAEPAAPAADKK